MPTDIVPSVLALVGSATGAGLTNVFLARSFAAKDSRAKETQTRWLPLLEAAAQLRDRFTDLKGKYRDIPKDRYWKKRGETMLPTWARDFHELYTLDDNPELILDLDNEAAPNPVTVLDAARKDEARVHRVRIRMGHQLTYAVSTMYTTARYLSYAQQVRRDLNAGRLDLRKLKMAAVRIESLLQNVRNELHGTSPEHLGAGIIFEQQDAMGEIMWSANNGVIEYSDFQSRLYCSPGWEKFTDLFRFFVEVDRKLDTEVEKTTLALKDLCDELTHMPGARRHQYAKYRAKRCAN